MKTELTKGAFLKIMKQIQVQIEHDRKCAAALKTVFPDSDIVVYNTSKIVEGTINLLKYLTDDIGEWITYFVWELDFGREYKPGMITSGEEQCDLSDAEQLWHFLEGNRNV